LSEPPSFTDGIRRLPVKARAAHLNSLAGEDYTENRGPSEMVDVYSHTRAVHDEISRTRAKHNGATKLAIHGMFPRYAGYISKKRECPGRRQHNFGNYYSIGWDLPQPGPTNVRNAHFDKPMVTPTSAERNVRSREVLKSVDTTLSYRTQKKHPVKRAQEGVSFNYTAPYSGEFHACKMDKEHISPKYLGSLPCNLCGNFNDRFKSHKVQSLVVLDGSMMPMPLEYRLPVQVHYS